MASERPSEPSNSPTHETLFRISTPAPKNSPLGDKVTSLTTSLCVAEYRLMDETLPEVTFLNESIIPLNDNDSAFPNSAPPTPRMARFVKSPAAAHGPPQLIIKYPDGSHSLRSFPPFSCGTARTSTAEYRLMDETMPEVTFLNDSTMPLNDNDSAFPNSAPPTPQMARFVKSPAAALEPPQLSFCADFKTGEQISHPLRKTMDSSPPSKSSCSSLIANSVETSVSPRNNTFDCKPPEQNGTITLSESIPSDSHECSKSSCDGVRIQLTTTKENTFEVRPAELSKHQEKTSSLDATHDLPADKTSSMDITEEIQAPNSAIVSNSELSTRNTLDESLDLRMDSVVTSTPLTTGKLFIVTEWEAGKDLVAQKKLDQEGPRKPAAPVPEAKPPSSFQKQTLIPPPKVSSHLSKYRAASALPGPLKPATSGLPVTRQRTQAEALRNAPKGLPGTSSSYNLRATTAGSKPPISGPLKPQSGIPSGIKRAAPAVRLPPARGNVLSSKSLCAPAAANPVTRISQARKHPAPTVDMSESKKMKMGCASCALLREKNKAMSEEIKRLKEELLRFQRQEEEFKK